MTLPEVRAPARQKAERPVLVVLAMAARGPGHRRHTLVKAIDGPAGRPRERAGPAGDALRPCFADVEDR